MLKKLFFLLLFFGSLYMTVCQILWNKKNQSSNGFKVQADSWALWEAVAAGGERVVGQVCTLLVPTTAVGQRPAHSSETLLFIFIFCFVFYWPFLSSFLTMFYQIGAVAGWKDELEPLHLSCLLNSELSVSYPVLLSVSSSFPIYAHHRWSSSYCECVRNSACVLWY